MRRRDRSIPLWLQKKIAAEVVRMPVQMPELSAQQEEARGIREYWCQKVMAKFDSLPPEIRARKREEDWI